MEGKKKEKNHCSDIFLFRLSRGSVLFPSLSVPLVFGAFFLFLLSKLHSASIINAGMNGDLKGEKKPGGFKKKKKILFPRVLQGRGHTAKVGRGVQSYCPCFLCPYPSNAPHEVHLVDGHQPQTHTRMGTQARARTHTHARPICLPGLVSGSLHLQPVAGVHLITAPQISAALFFIQPERTLRNLRALL